MILYLIYTSLDLYKAEAANAIEKNIISETNDEMLMVHHDLMMLEH